MLVGESADPHRLGIVVRLTGRVFQFFRATLIFPHVRIVAETVRILQEVIGNPLQGRCFHVAAELGIGCTGLRKSLAIVSPTIPELLQDCISDTCASLLVLQLVIDQTDLALDHTEGVPPGRIAVPRCKLVIVLFKALKLLSRGVPLPDRLLALLWKQPVLFLCRCLEPAAQGLQVLLHAGF